MKRKNYILTVSVVIILVLGLFFVLTDTKSVVTVQNPASDSLTAALSTTTVPQTDSNSESDTFASSTGTSTVKSTATSTTATSTASATTTYTVSYTSTGFSPNALTIALGQSVTFTNNSTSSMWVASDPYPDDTNYPEFNENKGGAAGTSYTFTFDRKGSFGFHDNIAPKWKGIIVVE